MCQMTRGAGTVSLSGGPGRNGSNGGCGPPPKIPSVLAMTTFDKSSLARVPAILTPEEQRAVWFLGALIRVRAGGESTGGRLAILEHAGPRGYSSPLHLHKADEETFFILDGDVRVEVGDRAFSAGPGTVAFLPRQIPHAFVVTSHDARFLTLHTPSGFDEFTLTAGAPADYPFGEPPAAPPDPAALAASAASYGIEILGPPPIPS